LGEEFFIAGLNCVFVFFHSEGVAETKSFLRKGLCLRKKSLLFLLREVRLRRFGLRPGGKLPPTRRVLSAEGNRSWPLPDLIALKKS
jgi:hypothetical protein